MSVDVDVQESVGQLTISDDRFIDGEYLSWLTDLERHPTLALLDRARFASQADQTSAVRFGKLDVSGVSADQQRATRLRRLANIGGEIRAALSDVGDVAVALADQTNQMLRQPNPLPAERVRLGMSKADQDAEIAKRMTISPRSARRVRTSLAK